MDFNDFLKYYTEHHEEVEYDTTSLLSSLTPEQRSSKELLSLITVVS